MGPISTEYFEKVYMNEEKDEATVGSQGFTRKDKDQMDVYLT